MDRVMEVGCREVLANHQVMVNGFKTNSWGGFRQAPDCFDSHDVYFSGNGINTMKLNTRDFNVRRLFFTSNASSQRILNADSNYRLFLNANNGVPKIENNSGTRHVFNAPITLNAGAELNPVDGDLDFDFIDNNSNSIDVYGDNGKVIRFLNVISGSGALRIKQYSIAKLSALNTYTGNTEIDEGELWIENGGDIASGSAIYLGNGGQLGNFTKFFLSKSDGGTNFTRTINVNPGNANTRYIGGLNASGTNTFSGNIVRNSNQPLNIEVVNAGGNVTFSGVINGSGTVTKVGNGTATFTGNNTYTGATAVTGGTLIVQKSGYAATITTSGIAVAFSSVPTRGTYTVLPRALSSSATLSTSGLGFGQTASFNASTGVLTVFDAPTVSLVSNDVDNSFCAGTSVTFTATANQVGGGTVNYDFKVAGSSVQSGASSTYTTTSLTNGQAVTVEITVTGGTYLSSTTATSNSIVNTVITPQLWYLDADGDGFGSGEAVLACENPSTAEIAYVSNADDCDDFNQNVYPGAPAICYNNIIEDCNGGTIYTGCPVLPVSITSPSCGSILNYRNAPISCNSVSVEGHTVQYRFRISQVGGSLSGFVTNSTPYFTLLQLGSWAHLYGVTYDVYVSLVIDGEQQGESSACRITTPPVPVLGQSLINCTTILTAATTPVYSPSVPGAVAYQFRVSLGSENYEFESSTNYFRLTDHFPTWNYDTTYTVEVRTRQFGEVFPSGDEGYGIPCTLTTPSVPVATQSLTNCATLLTAASSPVYSPSVYGATSYEFQISSSEGVYIGTISSLTTNFRLTTGLPDVWNYSREYQVRMRAIRNGKVGEWSSICTVSTPAMPTPAQALANCTTVMTSPTAILYASTVFGATSYVFNVAGFPEITKEVPYFRLSDMPEWVAGTVYSVTVKAIRNGVESGISSACTFKTPGTAPVAPVARIAQVPFAVKAYPNPYSNAFQLDVTSTDKTATIDIKVFDMLGRMVDSKNTTAGDLETATIGSDYPSGVYNVIVTQGEQTKVVRVVKR